jgi:hypothetical protein
MSLPLETIAYLHNAGGTETSLAHAHAGAGAELHTEGFMTQMIILKAARPSTLQHTHTHTHTAHPSTQRAPKSMAACTSPSVTVSQRHT